MLAVECPISTSVSFSTLEHCWVSSPMCAPIARAHGLTLKRAHSLLPRAKASTCRLSKPVLLCYCRECVSTTCTCLNSTASNATRCSTLSSSTLLCTIPHLAPYALPACCDNFLYSDSVFSVQFVVELRNIIYICNVKKIAFN